MKVCATCLARAHARTGDEAAIAGYTGEGDVLSESIADFSVTVASLEIRTPIISELLGETLGLILR